MPSAWTEDKSKQEYAGNRLLFHLPDSLISEIGQAQFIVKVPLLGLPHEIKHNLTPSKTMLFNGRSFAASARLWTVSENTSKN